MTTFTCPSCGKTIGAEVPAGSSVTCPLCNQVVTVPGDVPVAGLVQGAPPTWPGGVAPPVRQGMAITSMVLGILALVTGCFPIFGLVGLILGIVALRRTNCGPAEYGGKGYAIAGICTSLVSVVWVFGIAMMVAILLPSLSKARDLAKRSVCAANLGGTGKALAIYANQYGGQYPPDIDTLVRSGLAQPGQFVCPSSVEDFSASTTVTYNAGQPITPQLHEMLHRCYVYIPGQSEGGDPRDIVMYEKKECHQGEGGNVLFLDGHTAWIEPYSKVEEMAAETKARIAARGAGKGAAIVSPTD